MQAGRNTSEREVLPIGMAVFPLEVDQTAQQLKARWQAKRQQARFFSPWEPLGARDGIAVKFGLQAGTRIRRDSFWPWHMLGFGMIDLCGKGYSHPQGC